MNQSIYSEPTASLKKFRFSIAMHARASLVNLQAQFFTSQKKYSVERRQKMSSFDRIPISFGAKVERQGLIATTSREPPNMGKF